MWEALASTITQSVGLIEDKIILSRRGISLKLFLPVVFVFSFIFVLVLVPWLGHLNNLDTAFAPSTIFLLLIMVILGVAWNALFYQGIQRESAYHNELVMMLLPLFTVVLAAIFSPQNFSWSIFILAIIACCSLIFAKSKRDHFVIGPTSYNVFLAVILMAADSVVVGELLYSFNPVALFTIRIFFIALAYVIYFRPKYSSLSTTTWRVLAESALIGTIQTLTRYYAYSKVGIIYTTLFMALAPIVVFLGSWKLLHEHVRVRAVISAAVILACVIVATVINFK